MRANKAEQVAKNLGIGEEELDELYFQDADALPGQGFASALSTTSSPTFRSGSRMELACG